MRIMRIIRSGWSALFIFVVFAFWLGYWLGGLGGELAEFKDRLSWTGIFIGVMSAFPIAYILGGLAEHARVNRLPPPWRLFEEIRAQLEYLERLWKQSGDEFERAQKELAERKSADDIASKTTRREG